MLFFVTVTVVDSKQRLRTSLLCLIGGLALASLYTLREWQKGGFGTDRPGYVAGDANFFAAAALLTMPLAYLLLKEKRPMWEKIFCGTCLLATVLASLTAASRGAFIGLAFTYLYLLIRSRRKLALLFCALILVPVVLFAPTSPLRRILHPDYGDISSTATHQALWRAGLGFIAQHPLSGIGLGQFKSETERQQILQDASAVGHNTYIEIGAELGVPTLLLFIAMLISLFFLLERTRRDALIRGDLFLQDVTFGLQAGLVGFAPAAFFFSAEYEKPFWIVVFLSACARRMLDVQTAAETDTPLSEQQSELRGEFDPQRVTN
ncbi:MAG TPA: O-antigen ligase family protein [Candidatus Acidoferrales bacterium]|nr:O-antigen ligase family protein [Candidatus Acidoferrales bacterium]